MWASPQARTGLLGLAAYLAVAPLLAVLQAAAVLATARLLAGVDEHAVTLLAPLPVDPVYGGAALHIIGGIQAHALAVAGLPGLALHQLAPGLFANPALVPEGAVASALLEPGATVVSRTLVELAATVAMLALGLTVSGWHGAPPWLALAGVLLQLRMIVERAVEAGLTVRELEATGVPFAVAALAPVGPGGQRELFTRYLDDVPDAILGVGWGLLLATVAYGTAYALVRGPGLIQSLSRSVQRRRQAFPSVDQRARHRRCFARPLLRAPRVTQLAVVAGLRGGMVTAMAVALVVTPVGTIANADIAAPPDPAGGDESVVESTVSLMPAEAAAAGTAMSELTSTSVLPTKSVVSIEGRDYRFTYRVNGQPTVVRGMGYNPWYASLARSERIRRYDRDFASMQAIGVNTVEGWFENQFDEVTLDAANAHGLGAIMPFELNQDYDYGDPAVRDRFRQQVAAWVLRYKDHPAVRMWGPGNENMHRLIFPTVVKGQTDPSMEARADTFARFYVELIDLVHALDPDHPVVYRDAEDLYLGRIRDALLRDGTPRPWFVYGTNAYTPRLGEVIDRWPTQGLDAPLLVSEFSPGGVSPADRPRKLGDFWSMIRARPAMVLGGVVYTWATEGPEDLDRVFGLTDPDGRPIDGSLAALRRLFHDDGLATAAAPAASNE